MRYILRNREQLRKHYVESHRSAVFKLAERYEFFHNIDHSRLLEVGYSTLLRAVEELLNRGVDVDPEEYILGAVRDALEVCVLEAGQEEVFTFLNTYSHKVGTPYLLVPSIVMIFHVTPEQAYRHIEKFIATKRRE